MTSGWQCTNCAVPTETDAKGEERATPAKRERTPRKQEESEKTEAESLPPLSKTMGVLEYAANYFEFLIGREAETQHEEESEDVCFCCRDGGEVIECDWTGWAFCT